MQTAAANGFLYIDNGFFDCVDNVTRPRLHSAVLECVVQVVAAKATAEHDTETITRAGLNLIKR
ncbi:hypothetical protein ACUY3F_12000 [Corynebacterium marquesiae]